MSIRIKDTVILKLLDSNVAKIRDNLASLGISNNPTGKGIYARIAASHAGIINRNNFFYLPDKMKKGISTFTTPYRKPIIVNHNDEGEPIGRVVASKYVDTSGIIQDSVSDIKQITDMLKTQDMNAFLKGTMPLKDQVQFVCHKLYDSMLDEPSYNGLGYAEIIAHITDAAAIEKFLDGRYLTGSIAAATDHAFCSICQEDWSENGACEHRPGKIYDKKKMFLIAGDFNFEHWAVVNTPADTGSKTLEIANSLIDSVKVEDADFSGKLYEVNVDFLDSYKEENEMPIEVTDSTNESVEQPTTTVVNAGVVEAVDTQTVTSEVKAENKPAETTVVQDTKTQESFDDFVTRILDLKTELSNEDEEKLYGLMVEAMKEAGLDEKTIEDSKLSAEKRKSLAISAFCGPDRSFPCPDQAHVLAARHLVNQYKGTSNKDSVLASVERKAKAMGCPEVKPQVTVVEPPVTSVEFKAENIVDVAKLNNDQLVSVVDTLFKAAKERNMNIRKQILKSEDTALLDEIVKLETLAGTLRDELKQEKENNIAFKEEVSLSVAETNTLRDALVNAKTQLRDAKIKRLALLKSLKEGKTVEIKDSADITDSTIDTDLDSLTKDVDIQKIADKLNDGMSRKPVGIVESPSPTLDNTQEGVKVEDVKKELERIENVYYQLLFTNSFTAHRYKEKEIARLRQEGKLP